MESHPNPFSIILNTGIMSSFETGKVAERHLSQLKDYFADQAAVSELLSQSDPLIYQTWEQEYEGSGRGISVGMTRILPGTVGREYYMTRGHFHAGNDGDEVYVVMSGKGSLLLFDRDNQGKVMEMLPGHLYYVPANLAHRTANTGAEDFVFLSIWPPHIDHDYATITQTGFPQLLLATETGVEIQDNPRFTVQETI